VKDLEHAAGFVTSFGSAAYAGGPPAETDSVQVARLRAAGCVILGKTNAPELGLRGETDNRTFGITRNPWNLSRTPGGSSGGSSAALAAGMVPLATGSDGGGSIRIPSAVTGLSGLKPSYGRVPVSGREPPGWHGLSCRGPMARQIRDVAIALDVVAGPHPYDAQSLPASQGSFAAAVDARRVPRRVVWSPALDGTEVDSEILAVCEAAVGALEKAGTEVVTVDTVFQEPPALAIATMVQSYIWRTVEPLRDTPWWQELDPLVVVAAEMARATVGTALDFVGALDAAHRINVQRADAMEGADFLLCPTTRGQTAICENPATVDSLLGLFADAIPDAAAAVGAGVFDALLAHLRAVEPINVPMGTVNGKPSAEWHGLTQAFNLSRVPAGNVCAGFTGDGMPVGLQVVGHPHDDAGVLAAVAVFEDVLGLDALAPDLSG
jgi:Asp-tRNA(Asn)/Glu-tRNA(Gln) amidotransferase A subunit family amidase